MTGIQLDWNDVWSNLKAIQGKLTLIGILLVVMIVLVIFAKRFFKDKEIRRLFRMESLLCFLLALGLIVNSILLNEERELLNSAFTEFGTLSEESIANSRAVIEEVADEGIVLLSNRNLPFDSTTKLNVFGWASTNPVYGGTGSGTVNAETAVGVLEGLEAAGFETNSELSDFYREYCQERPAITINNGQDWTLPEPVMASYSDSMLSNAKDFSDTAVIVIARCGGEGADIPKDMGGIAKLSHDTVVAEGDEPWVGSEYYKNTKYTKAFYKNNGDYDDFESGDSYLQLSKTEEDLVDYVCSNYKNVAVVYNGSNVFELDWVKNYPSISGVLICPSAGLTGFSALGNIIAGNVNPSGKTVDTWVNDVTLTPTFNNVGHYAYSNVDDITSAAYDYVSSRFGMTNVDQIVSFVNYTEGIYVGYRFYETAYAEAAAKGSEFDFDYDKVVSYPFGYGESYTSFEKTLDSMKESNGTITAVVTVKNTGTVAGKDVVELYYTPPYTNGGIEKSAVNLVAFDKTELLEPGAEETVTLTFDTEDMASFDSYGTGYYKLEAGDYSISLRSDAHTVIAEESWNNPSDIVYNDSNLHNGDLETAESRLSDAEGLEYHTYLSRADHFANYKEAVAAPEDYEIHTDVTLNGNYDVTAYNDDSDEMPTTGAKNGVDLVDLRGADYDDEAWDALLDELTVDDMVNMIAKGGWQTAAVSSINKMATIDSDGPAGITYALSDGGTGSGYCGEIMLAMTWNTDLAAKLADGVAREMVDMGVTGWYAPSMNIHRTVFGGRNFEYYSEDSLLSAKMAVAECEAVYSYGVYPYIKHFAFNEQETNRNGALCTWLTEQSAREIYLKPFEEVVKANDGTTNGEPLAVMSSYVYVGSEWDGGYTPLLQDILRGEWGFKGLVLTDYFGDYGYMDADKAIRGGTDMMLVAADTDNIPTDQASATSLLAMRRSCHDILYTVVNTSAFSEENYAMASATPAWLTTLRTIDIILLLIFAALQAVTIRSYLLNRKKNVE